MENISKLEKLEKTHDDYSNIPEYQLAGRYVKQFLEARTEGRRVHSWDHTLFVADHSLKALNTYYERETSNPSESEEFSVYIASLLHDVIQPNDIRNNDLKETMETEWGLDVAGSEYSEGVKAFNYIVDDLNEKIHANSSVSDNQKSLIEKLIANREQILKIYSEKENKDLQKLPWAERSFGSRSLSISDLLGNWNPDMVVKFATYISSDNPKKTPEKRLKVDDASDILVSKVFKEGINKPSPDAKPKVLFTYNFFHDPEIIKDWKEVLPETMSDYEGFIKYIQTLKNEKDLLVLRPRLKQFCEDNGVGVFGMFAFWYKEGDEDARATSQEIFEKYMAFLSKRRSIAEIAQREHLSEEDISIIERLEISKGELVHDISKWQKKLAKSEQSLGQKI